MLPVAPLPDRDYSRKASLALCSMFACLLNMCCHWVLLKYMLQGI